MIEWHGGTAAWGGFCHSIVQPSAPTLSGNKPSPTQLFESIKMAMVSSRQKLTNPLKQKEERQLTSLFLTLEKLKRVYQFVEVH